MPEQPPLDRSRLLKGRDLRHAALALLQRHGTLSVRQLLEALHGDGFVVGGLQPNKTLSDALRHEIVLGRARRVAWGRYRAARIPRTSAWRIQNRWAARTGETITDIPEHVSPPPRAKPTGNGWYRGRWRWPEPPHKTSPRINFPGRRQRPWGPFTGARPQPSPTTVLML